MELPQTDQNLKQCCAALYESDLTKLLLGDSFHPGGLGLTQRLGDHLNLCPGQHILDVASGKGSSAIFLAQQYSCKVVGVDYGTETIAQARANVSKAGLSGRVWFEQGDAECLQFDDGSFDAVICECAFCTFPDKAAAANEFARVLRPGGQIGLSDLTRTDALPPELDTLLAWIACIADAQPVNIYTSHLKNAGFAINKIEPHDNALANMVKNIQAKLLGTEIMIKLGKLQLPDIDLEQAKTLARHAAEAIRQKKLGYTLITATKKQD